MPADNGNFCVVCMDPFDEITAKGSVGKMSPKAHKACTLGLTAFICHHCD